MRWLIDGYNVIRRDADLRAAEASGLEAGRTALLRRVAAVARRSPDQFTVVFDGALPRARGPGDGQVQVVFSQPPRKADDVLVELARRLGAGAVVVSSDRAIQNAARRAGAAVAAAEAFLARLEAPGPGPDDRKDDD